MRRGQQRLATLGFAAAAMILGGCDLGLAEPEGVEIGPRGGVVTSDDGRITLDVPAGALTETATLQIVESDHLPEDAVGPAYAIEPFGLGFLAPAEIAYDVSGGLMDDADAVRLVTERDHGWDMLADHVVDIEHEEVSASVLFAARVGIVE